MPDQNAAKNTDRELWRGPDEGNGSYYADSVHITVGGGIGMNVGGSVIVMRPNEWHNVCKEAVELRNKLDAAEVALTAIAAMPDEDDEWDGRDKFREIRAIAQNAVK